jgi:hypothetical protein
VLLDDNIAAVRSAMSRRQAAPQNPDDDGLFSQLLAKAQIQNAPQPTAVAPYQAAISRAMPHLAGAYHAGVGIPGGSLTSINSQGQHWTVAKGAASHFQGLLNELAGVGYKVHSDGGYVDRDIRGRPGQKSEHAYGRAIDINAAQNGLGSLVNTFPKNISQLAAKYGLTWGGDFKHRKDPMHFEYNGA